MYTVYFHGHHRGVMILYGGKNVVLSTNVGRQQNNKKGTVSPDNNERSGYLDKIMFFCINYE